jgi:type I restriction enzyme S subunit
MRPITYGIVQAGENDPDGVPYIRPVDMTDHDGVADVAGLLRTAPSIAQAYKRSEVQVGDIVISIGPSYGKTMLVGEDLAGANLTQGTARVAVSYGHDSRYVRWALRSAVASASWDAAVGGATFRALNLEPLGETPIPLWPHHTQRAIADYLDRETARIDALIAAKKRMVGLMEERRDARISTLLWSPDCQPIRLKFLTQLPTSGNRDHSSFTFTETGIPCLRGLNIRPGSIDRTNLLRLSPEDHLRHAGTRLRQGDIVVVRSGLAGVAAVIPEDLDDSNCVDLVIIRRTPRILPKYLEYIINSREAREQVGQHSVGALLTHFNAADAADLLVAFRELSHQHAVMRHLEHLEEEHDAMCSRLVRQIGLLQEHRQALITAAVTGQLDLPEAA